MADIIEETREQTVTTLPDGGISVIITTARDRKITIEETLTSSQKEEKVGKLMQYVINCEDKIKRVTRERDDAAALILAINATM